MTAPASALRRVAAVTLLTSLAATACSADTVAAPIVTPLPEIAPETWAHRGEIVEGTALPDVFDDPDHVIGQARRATYRSASGVDGGPRTVSGTFFVPLGAPPDGGWPVVSMGHGTTGIGRDCAPSLDSTLSGFLPAVTGYLAKGYAVAMTDYEGLGTPGRHPYLEPKSAAFNVIDAVRAQANLFPEVSRRWVGFGNSQGGQAVWAAGELADWYGTGLDLRGVVALSPAANITPIASLARAGRLTEDQQAVLPMIVAGVADVDSDLRAQLHQTGSPPAEFDPGAGCTPNADTTALAPADFPASDEQAGALRDALRRVALPQRPLTAPMLVINGLDDQMILPGWVSAAVDRACDLGGRVQHAEVTGAGHGDLGELAYDTAFQWVRIGSTRSRHRRTAARRRPSFPERGLPPIRRRRANPAAAACRPSAAHHGPASGCRRRP